jgi:hypothetical protein
MCPMRALKALLGLLSVVTLTAALSGCGNDVASKIMCNEGDDAACMKAGAALFDVDASVSALPRCCTGVCVLSSPGCDSGYRFLTSMPSFGDCAPMVMCKAGPDMSVPRDMTEVGD